MKDELADECNYAREADCMRSFGSAERLGGDERFRVPWVWEGSTDRVLVMEHVDGTSVGEDVVHRLPQADRDEVRSTALPTKHLTNATTHKENGARTRAQTYRPLRLQIDEDVSQLVQPLVE